MIRRVNIQIGDRFDRLTAVSEIFSVGKRRFVWVRCDCDYWHIYRIRVDALRSKCPTRSCGCLQKEIVSEVNTTHGKSGSRIYGIWVNMITRCTDSTCREYKNYGGRGIKVCERWLKFENFYADMGDPPSDDYSLDRIENHRDYYLENCRWATWKEQQNNKRTNVFLEIFGERKTISQWGEDSRCVIELELLYTRIREGWDPEKALTTENLSKEIFVEIFGERKRCSEWADDNRCAVHKTTFYRRIHSGMNPEEALILPSRRRKW